jgi:hypothetical protein
MKLGTVAMPLKAVEDGQNDVYSVLQELTHDFRFNHHFAFLNLLGTLELLDAAAAKHKRDEHQPSVEDVIASKVRGVNLKKIKEGLQHDYERLMVV